MYRWCFSGPPPPAQTNIDLNTFELEVCSNFLQGQCSLTCCHFAHPYSRTLLGLEKGRVTVCSFSANRECPPRECQHPNCPFYHPPAPLVKKLQSVLLQSALRAAICATAPGIVEESGKHAQKRDREDEEEGDGAGREQRNSIDTDTDTVAYTEHQDKTVNRKNDRHRYKGDRHRNTDERRYRQDKHSNTDKRRYRQDKHSNTDKRKPDRHLNRGPPPPPPATHSPPLTDPPPSPTHPSPPPTTAAMRHPPSTTTTTHPRCRTPPKQ